MPNEIAIPLRILVVDDYRDGMQTMAALLSELGHEVVTCNRSTECLDIARQFHPQLVLLDLAMPDVDGFRVAEQLIAATELSPMVLAALTGFGDERTRERCLKTGFQYFLLKPASVADLDAVLLKVKRDLGLLPG